MAEEEPGDRAVRLYRDERRSISQIAAALGWKIGRVRRYLLAVGVTLRTRVDGVRSASADGRLGGGAGVGTYERTEEIREKTRASQLRRRQELRA